VVECGPDARSGLVAGVDNLVRRIGRRHISRSATCIEFWSGTRSYRLMRCMQADAPYALPHSNW
jgi:hypothetical protein